MELRQERRQVHQQALRHRLEQGMDAITDIFSSYYEDDVKNLSAHLLDVFMGANDGLDHRRIAPSWEYAARSKDAYLRSGVGRSLEAVIKGHVGQYRDSGAHYASHPVQVAYLLTEFGFGEDVVIAGNLHDVPEENEDRFLEVMEEIDAAFGSDVAFYVMALSVFDKGESRDERQIRTLWHASDELGNYDLFYIKLADVLTNLYTKRHMLGKNGMSAEERRRKFEDNARKNILPLARLVDEEQYIDLHVTSYLQELIGR